MPLFSVIIPVYNASKYLRRCLDSVRGQTFGDWQAVCVNDGSTDDSLEILKSYAGADSRFTIVDKPNGGVSESRNVAMSHVCGDFVLYLDSDDFLHPRLMEICNRIIINRNPDLITYTYDRRYRTLTMLKNFIGLPEGSKKKFTAYNPDVVELKETENIFEFVTEYSHVSPDGIERRWIVKHCQPWRAVYRKKVVEDVHFIPGIIYEDFPWWGEVLLNVKKAVILDLPLYFYYPNPKSYIMSSADRYRIESLKKAIDASEKILDRIDDPFKKSIWRERFIRPFRAKLEAKLKRSKEN